MDPEAEKRGHPRTPPRPQPSLTSSIHTLSGIYFQSAMLSNTIRAFQSPAAAAARVAALSTAKRGMSISSLAQFEGKHFISIDQLSNDELRGLLDLSKKYRDTYGKGSSVDPVEAPKPLTGQSVSMIFQKRSTRTRVSTETGMNLLGGQVRVYTYGCGRALETNSPSFCELLCEPKRTRNRNIDDKCSIDQSLFLGPSDIQLGVNESMRDTALVLSRFNSLVLARVFAHDDILELSKYATVPVINALSDLHHPLQTLADLMALEDHFGDLKGKTLAWVGDGNNVLHDL